MAYALPYPTSARYETLGAGTGTGTTVTANVTTNTKGSYSTIGTTSFEYDGIYVSLSTFSSVGRYRVDIAINTTADEIIVPDLFIDTSGSTATSGNVFLPIAVPSGAVIKAAIQSNVTAVTLSAIVTGVQMDSRGLRGFSRAVSCTDWTSTDPTGSVSMNGTTQTAWAAVRASTPARIGALYASIDARGASMTGTDILFDIGWGAAASERVLTRFLMRGTNSGHQTFYGPFPCDFPAGTRLAFRGQASTTNTNTLGMSLLGIAI